MRQTQAVSVRSARLREALSPKEYGTSPCRPRACTAIDALSRMLLASGYRVLRRMGRGRVRSLRVRVGLVAVVERDRI